MTTHWAIDLGMPNTTVCEDRSGRPHIVNIPDLAKLEPVTQTPVMPSCVCVTNADGTDVPIGQEAVTYNWDGQDTGFAKSLKRYLGTESQRTLGRGAALQTIVRRLKNPTYGNGCGLGSQGVPSN